MSCLLSLPVGAGLWLLMFGAVNLLGLPSYAAVLIIVLVSAVVFGPELAEAHLGPGWEDLDDNALRDLIEMNEQRLEMIKSRKRFRGQKAIICRLEARITVLQREEDRRIRESS